MCASGTAGPPPAGSTAPDVPWSMQTARRTRARTPTSRSARPGAPARAGDRPGSPAPAGTGHDCWPSATSSDPWVALVSLQGISPITPESRNLRRRSPPRTLALAWEPGLFRTDEVVLMQPRLPVEVLPRKPQVVLHRAGRAHLRLTEGLVRRLPRQCPGAVAHRPRRTQVVDVVLVDRRAIVDPRQRSLAQPPMRLRLLLPLLLEEQFPVRAVVEDRRQTVLVLLPHPFTQGILGIGRGLARGIVSNSVCLLHCASGFFNFSSVLPCCNCVGSMVIASAGARSPTLVRTMVMATTSIKNMPKLNPKRIGILKFSAMKKTVIPSTRLIR